MPDVLHIASRLAAGQSSRPTNSVSLIIDDLSVSSLRCPLLAMFWALNNPQANEETFKDGWMRIRDEAVVRKSPQGNEHIFIVDRIKELIKVEV